MRIGRLTYTITVTEEGENGMLDFIAGEIPNFDDPCIISTETTIVWEAEPKDQS